MPTSIYYHLYDSHDPNGYTYSEGTFYTVAEEFPTTAQQKYWSSGQWMGFGSREQVVTKLIQEIINYLAEEDSEYDMAVVNEHDVADDDFCARFSGPPDRIICMYKLDRETRTLRLVPESRVNLLQINV